MLLYTEVYIAGEEGHDFLPEDRSNDEIMPAVIRVEDIEYAYKLDEQHTSIGTSSGRMMIKTQYEFVVERMKELVG